MHTVYLIQSANNIKQVNKLRINVLKCPSSVVKARKDKGENQIASKRQNNQAKFKGKNEMH